MNDTDDPFYQGYDAYLAGIDQVKNPYDVTTDFDNHCSWNDGWEAAFDDNPAEQE